MQKPIIPGNEQARIDALRTINMLDTPAEERFDRVTRLAKRVFNISISLVSLIDTNRQWFKSMQGLAVNETSRDISFCGHAILGEGAFYIENALEDPRFAKNPLVLGPPNIRFYAGIPLTVADGIRVGTLCLIDDKPRSFDQQDQALLISLGAMVERKLLSNELATFDSLTHLSNREGFDLLSSSVRTYCQSKEIAVALIMCDIDKVSEIESIFGKSEGEHLLVAFAEIMKKGVDDAALLARTDHHQFSAMLMHYAPEQVTSTIDKLRKSLQKYNQKSRRGYDIECQITSELVA